MGKIIFQTQASCPIDRRPFRAVCQLGALEDQIKIQVEKQQKRKKEEEYCTWNKEKYSHAKMRRFLRRAACSDRGSLAAKLRKVVKKKCNINQIPGN
ncbi:protein SCAF11-like isoform X2 [Meleagris gallopavo]|uniref:protein SCAF11-like isoform X2 n=1 Tax=Meleagris gallopavo TaxID=9103 RepID=UPI000938C1B3|nr:protein SCAF11-like isoform X2 [Meleagris gallopavo]